MDDKHSIEFQIYDWLEDHYIEISNEESEDENNKKIGEFIIHVLLFILHAHIYMVTAVVEPVFAGLLVSLINKYMLSGLCSGWIRQSCDATEAEETIEEEGENVEEEEEEAVSSTNTTISDAIVHMHCH